MRTKNDEKPFRCKIGLHKDIKLPKTKDIIDPKVGPKDPRTDEERTRKDVEVGICVLCGREVEWWNQWDVSGLDCI